MSTPRQIRPLVRVALPVAIAALLIVLAVINVVLVKAWRGEPDDGVNWGEVGVNVVAKEIAKGSAADLAGLEPGIAEVEPGVGQGSVALLHLAQQARCLFGLAGAQQSEGVVQLLAERVGAQRESAPELFHGFVRCGGVFVEGLA